MRLEFLWQQLSYHAGQPNAWSSRSAVAGLLEILAITSRGDARGDVLKELERQMSALRDFQNRPGVDGARLRTVLSALMRRREELNAAGANFLQKLRESEFLNAIKHRSAIPGGTCEFDLPDFYHWLSLDRGHARGRPRRLARDDPPAVRVGLGTAVDHARERAPARGDGAGRQVPDRVRARPAGAAPAHHAAGRVAALPRSERQPPPLLAALPALEQRAQPAGAGERRRPVRARDLLLSPDGARGALPALRHAPRMERQSRGARSAASAASSSTSAAGWKSGTPSPASRRKSPTSDSPKH